MHMHIEEVAEGSYLYVDCSAPMESAAVGKAMGEGFGKVVDWMTRHGIPPSGQPLCVHLEGTPGRLAFRAGIPVAADDLRGAGGALKAGRTPSGRVAVMTHEGPYAGLGAAWELLAEKIAHAGERPSGRGWEIYVDDPGEVPEARLRTELRMALA